MLKVFSGRLELIGDGSGAMDSGTIAGDSNRGGTSLEDVGASKDGFETRFVDVFSGDGGNHLLTNGYHSISRMNDAKSTRYDLRSMPEELSVGHG